MKLIEVTDYTRPKETEQDLISKNPLQIANKLKGYIQIYPEHYKDIECGIWIRYITKDKKKYRCGGALTVNKAPDYFILKNPFNTLTWSVNLHNNHIFMRGTEAKVEKIVEKNNLYKLYLAGMVQIVENDNNDDDTEEHTKK